jgi:2-keto-4-pentenoate hydratase
VIEVLQTRLADWKDSDPLAQLADLGSHGALILGAPCAMRPADLDLRQVRADLAFDGQPVASTFGANSAVDVWRELRWLAQECARRGQPLRAGTVITTGSCTGTLFAPEGALVQAEVHGMGRVALQF